MSIPSKSAQIDSLVAFLEDSTDKERDVRDVAKQILDSVYDMWTVDVHDAPPPLRVGLAFKDPLLLSKTYFVGWIGVEAGKSFAWCIEPTTDYGFLAPLDSGIWRIITESPDGRRKPKDGSQLGPRPGSPGNNVDGWETGDVVSLIQRIDTFDILATGDKTVLMRSRDNGRLQADKNANLAKYYQKESGK